MPKADSFWSLISRSRGDSSVSKMFANKHEDLNSAPAGTLTYGCCPSPGEAENMALWGLITSQSS